ILRGKLAEFDPGSALKPELPGRVSLQSEQTGLALPSVWQEFLIAANTGITIEILNATCPTPARMVTLNKLEAAFATIAEEARVDTTLGIELVMMIFRNAAARSDLAEESADRDLGTSIITGLP